MSNGKVSLAYGDDVAVAKRTMLAMLESDKRVLHTPDAPADPFVALSELADSAIVVVARSVDRSTAITGISFSI